jgi:nitrate reductase molybdenum cofactor assembly chaperone
MRGTRPPSRGILASLAVLLTYPSAPDWRRDVLGAAAAVGEEDTSVRRALSPFLRHVTATEASLVEEGYTRTFDWSRERSLDLGWHLHGETYDRGAFMVRMRELLRRGGIAEEGQLPDHLPRVLAALDALGADEMRELVADEILPAVLRLEQGFRDRDDPYAGVIRGVRLALESRVSKDADVPTHAAGRGVEG